MRMLFLMAAAAALPAVAQTYPTKPVRMLIGFAPGSSTDIIGRIVAQKQGELLGQQVVVENRPGAGANIAAELTARAAPDGYTMLYANGGIATSAAAYSKLSYDAVRDLAAITHATDVAHMIVTHPALAAKTVKEMIALAKARPGQLNFSSAGTGNSDHMAGELFKSMAGIDMVHIPYKGGVQAAQDVISGQVATYFAGVPVVAPFIKAGKLRAVAVTTRARHPQFPEIPTIAESGLPGYEHSLWGMLFVPAATPKELVARLNAETIKALRAPDVAERLSSQGVQVVGSSPEQASAHLRSEIDKWRKVVRQIGLKLD